MSHELSISNWGPAAWRFLHTVSFTYQNHPTVEDKQNMYLFLTYFSRVLPCKRCRNDFTEYVNSTLSTESQHLNSREDLTKYINKAHNHVNRKIGKKIFTYDECRNKYLSPKENNNSQIIFIILLLTILLTIIMRNKKKNNR